MAMLLVRDTDPPSERGGDGGGGAPPRGDAGRLRVAAGAPGAASRAAAAAAHTALKRCSSRCRSKVGLAAAAAGDSCAWVGVPGAGVRSALGAQESGASAPSKPRGVPAPRGVPVSTPVLMVVLKRPLDLSPAAHRPVFQTALAYVNQSTCVATEPNQSARSRLRELQWYTTARRPPGASCTGVPRLERLGPGMSKPTLRLHTGLHMFAWRSLHAVGLAEGIFCVLA